MGSGSGRRDERTLAGTLDMLILRALAAVRNTAIRLPPHSERIGRSLKVEEGALYPALHRLEVRGELRSQWGTSDNNRRAKYYRLTVPGPPHGRERIGSLGAALERCHARAADDLSVKRTEKYGDNGFKKRSHEGNEVCVRRRRPAARRTQLWLCRSFSSVASLLRSWNP